MFFIIINLMTPMSILFFLTAMLDNTGDKGQAVLLVSTELEEVMSLSDRIGVIYEGQIVGEMAGADASEERIGMLMAGAKEHDIAPA